MSQNPLSCTKPVTIDPAKEQHLHRALDPMALGGLALDLVGMTPCARHVNHADLSDDGLLPDQVTVSVLATAYQPRRPRGGACAC